MGIVDALPDNILTDCLARVATFSMKDLFHAKMSCKMFNRLAEDDYIYQRVSVANILRILRRCPEEGNAFIQRCINCGNQEAMYNQGLYKYVIFMEMESGLELLKRAAQIGHLGASYIGGLLLIYKGGEFKKEGIQLLRKVYSSGQVVECRKKYISEASNICWHYGNIGWRDDAIFPEELPRFGCSMWTQHCKRRGWVEDIDYYDETECEQCICQAETWIMYRYCKPTMMARRFLQLI